MDIILKGILRRARRHKIGCCLVSVHTPNARACLDRVGIHETRLSMRHILPVHFWALFPGVDHGVTDEIFE